MECSVYARSKTLPFPTELKSAIAKQYRLNFALMLALFAVGLMLIALLIWLGYRSYFPIQVAEQQAANLISELSATPPMPAKASVTPTGVLSMKTIAPPTSTHTIAATSAPLQKHAMDVPVSVDGQELIIHMIASGEQLVILARNYRTNVDTILALNYQIPETVWAGSTIIIAPGLLAADTTKPSFSAYKITDKEITVENLASKLGVDRELLKQYNHCPAGCLLSGGDWVIVPHAK